VKGRRHEGLLRCYPRDWRDRYGDELLALLEDTYGEEPLPGRARLGVIRGGITEHLRRVDIGAGDRTPSDRVRSGSLLVLCAWGLVVLGGGGFAKISEHWTAAVSPRSWWLPVHGSSSVRWAAVAGLCIVAGGAFAVLPAFVRFLRAGGWAQARRPVGRAGLATAITILVGATMREWAHHLTSAQRNGGLWSYQGIAVLAVLSVAATIASWEGAAVSIVRHLRLSPRVLRLEGVLALAVFATIVVAITGTLVWWAAVASDAPGFLSGSRPAASGSGISSGMVMVGLLMTAGLIVALGGAARVARSMRSVTSE
jgi:hypothetical protein